MMTTQRLGGWVSEYRAELSVVLAIAVLVAVMIAGAVRRESESRALTDLCKQTRPAYECEHDRMMRRGR